MANTHTVPPGNAVVFGGKRPPFPRTGAWTVVDGKLGVLYALADRDGVPSASVHFIDGKGNTIMHMEIIKDADDNDVQKLMSDNWFPVSQIRAATHAEMIANVKAAHVTAFDAAVLGYEIADEHLRAMTALQRHHLGRSLDESDVAQAEIEKSEAKLAELKRARVAKHPDAIALEEQIEQERLAFIASVEQRRQALFDKLS